MKISHIKDRIKDYKMIHPDTRLAFVSTEVGSGVFATAFIPKGTIVYIKDDMEITLSPDNELLKDKKYKKIVDTYSYRDESGNFIVSWDIAKYVNHCCEPNTLSTGYGFEIAIKDIQPGDQITDEYGLLNIETPIPLKCDNCNCRGVVSPEDYKVHLNRWDENVKNALKEVRKVNQPLWEFLKKNTESQLVRYLETGSDYLPLSDTIMQLQGQEK